MSMAAKVTAFLGSCAVFVSMIGTFAFTGCVSHTNFQSPKVLDPGQVAAGVGVAAWTVKYGGERQSGLAEVDLYGRVGLVRHLDAGIKLFGPFGGIFGDVKYQFWLSPPFLAFDLGASYGHFGDMPDSGDDFDYIGLYPTLLFGRQDLYGGVRLICAEEIRHYRYGSRGTSKETDYRPGILIGASAGDRLRVIPELSLYINPHREDERSLFFIVGGIALQYVSH